MLVVCGRARVPVFAADILLRAILLRFFGLVSIAALLIRPIQGFQSIVIVGQDDTRLQQSRQGSDWLKFQSVMRMRKGNATERATLQRR